MLHSLETYQLACRSAEVMNNFLASRWSDLVIPRLSRRLLEEIPQFLLFPCCIMAATGCRFSEMKKLNYQSLNSDGRIMIYGTKGSLDRLLPFLSAEQAQRILDFNSAKKIFNTNPSALNLAIFRAQAKINLNIESKINKKTHIFRHIKVNDLDMKRVNRIEISNTIGHTDPMSTDNYFNTIPKKFLY